MDTSGVGGASSVRYTSDKRASQFTVQAFASGLISAIAHSPKIAIADWSCEVVGGTLKLQDELKFSFYVVCPNNRMR